ncbi:MAG: hypothetical protein ACO3FQ_04325 [Terrimicrobiaceae bacterium]
MFLKPVRDRGYYFFFFTAFLAAGFLAAAFLAGAFLAGAFFTAFLAAGFLAAAFLAGAFFLAVGINLPPFFPQMRESCCEKIVNNSLARVNKFGLEMRQQLFSILTKFLENIFAEVEMG